MNEKKELTAADLALYIGCEVKFRNEVFILERISTSGWIAIGSYEDQYFWDPERHISEVKPILRPLSDMTVDERQGIEDVGLCLHELQAEFHRVKYLLSKHFDLFGWIEAGLAIDKTKI